MRWPGALLLCVVALCLPWGCNGLNGPGKGEEKNGPGRRGESTPPLETRALWSPDFPVDRLPQSDRVDGKLDVPLQRDWRYIVIHHSATERGNEATFDRVHRQERGWKGVGYDFVIGNGSGAPDGLIEVTFRWEKQITGAHAGVDRYNRYGIGICLVGDFSTGHPTDRQMRSLVALVTYLQDRCHIPTTNVMLHRHVKDTECPGKNFPYYRFISLLGR